MFQFSFSIQALFQATIKTDQERDYVQYWSIEEFQKAVVELNNAGLTSDQIQILEGIPFSRFHPRQYSEVLLLALAIRKKTTTVEKIHQYLQEREYWARIHGNSICIEAENLPEIATINSYLGLRNVHR